MIRLEKLAVVYLATVLVVSSFCVFVALPVQSLGIYSDVEPVSAALHLVCSLLAFGLLAMSVANPGRVVAAIGAPFVVVFGIGVLGVVLSPFSHDWARSLNGTLEAGVGALWFVEAAVLGVAANLVWSASARSRLVLASAPLVAVVVCAVLQQVELHVPGRLLAPYRFHEYVGLYALFAAVPMLAATSSRVSRVAIFVLLSVLVASSGNRAAGLALVASAVIFGAGVKWPSLLTPRRLAAAVVGLSLLLFGVVLVAAPALEAIAVSTLKPSPDVASAEPLDHVEIQQAPYGTLWQRSQTLRLVAREMAASPEWFLKGRGFGAFHETAAEGRYRVPGRTDGEGPATMSAAYWDGLAKARSHSHNESVELMLSVGVAGFVLWHALLWAVAMGARRENIAATSVLLGAMTVACGLWFFLNSAMPFIAIAIASAGSGGGASNKVLGKVASASVALGASVLALSFALLGIVGASVVQAESEERAMPPIPGIVAGRGCAGFSALGMSDREINEELYGQMVRRIVGLGEVDRARFVADRKGNIQVFSCLMKRYARHDHDALAMGLSMYANQAAVELRSVEFQDALGDGLRQWGDDLMLYMKTDRALSSYVFPYVKMLELTQKPEVVVQVVDLLKPSVPDGDPMREWLEGKKAELNGDRTEYFRVMNAALDHGLANRVVVSQDSVGRTRAGLGATH